MEIHIVENEKNLRVVIECRQVDEQVTRLKSHIELFDNKIQAKKENEYYLIEALEVLYFESVDNRVFAYTENQVLEIKQRLYELEDILSGKDFIRISKSQIVNVNKVRTLKPEINRTILVTMCNGEMLYVSRSYVKQFRNLLSI